MHWSRHLSILFCDNQLIITLRQDFQLSSISTITKMTYKRKQLFSRSSFSSLAMIISHMYNFGVGRYYDANIFFNNICKLYSPYLRCSRSASEECVYSTLSWNDCHKTYKSRKSRGIVGIPPFSDGQVEGFQNCQSWWGCQSCSFK